VGAFVPFLRELKRMGQPYLVLEQDPATLKADEMPFYRHAVQAPAVAPQADVLLVTGTTLLNDTLDEILAAARPDACKVVVGPTVGLVPDAYLRRGCSGSHRRFRLPAAGDRICDMLGIPEEDRQVCFTSSRAAGRLLDLAPLSKAEIEEQNADNLAMAAYFQRLFELRRREPGNDLTTHLVQAEEDGNKLTNEELTANIILLFGAGHETTVNLIGNGLLALHRNPDQLRLLKSDPSLMANAIEELLRYDSSVQVTGRTTLEDVDEIGGIALAKGQSVICLLGSANRDPEVYPDPDRLDISRRDVRPFSFGGGIHYCVGAQLARIEAEIAIATLLRRLPNLRLDDIENPDWRQTFVLRGLNKLPASW